MTKTTRFPHFVILSAMLVSCGAFSTNSPQNTTPTAQPTLASSAPKPLINRTPSITPTVSLVTPSPANDSACVEVSSTAPSEGWNCLNESYGFTVHFPSTAGVARTTDELVDIWLENSPSNPRVERMIEIFSGKRAEQCFSSDDEKLKIGEHDFIIDHGYEPSGVIYEWRSYAVEKASKRVCFVLVVGFREWEQDDPPFPPEEDQGLDEVEAILATFQWLNP